MRKSIIILMVLLLFLPCLARASTVAPTIEPIYTSQSTEYDESEEEGAPNIVVIIIFSLYGLWIVIAAIYGIATGDWYPFLDALLFFLRVLARSSSSRSSHSSSSKSSSRTGGGGSTRGGGAGRGR